MLKYFLVCSLFTKGIFAALTGNCALDGVSAQQWLYWYDNEPVEDVEIEIFKTFKATNVTGVKVAPNGHYIKYVVVKYEQEEDGKVIVSPTEEFQKFEANEPYTPNTLINIELQFTCSEGTGTLVFYQPIKDTNNHEPYFGQSEYSCKLPMPLPADFNIGLLTNLNVFATDIDISNEKVIFSIDGDDFVLNYAEKDTLGKTHKAIIMTKKAVALSQKQSYVLTVQDLGTPPKIGTAVLIIDVDENTTFKPNPAFDKATYFGNYKVNKTLHSFSHEPIKLTKWIDGTKISVEGEYSGNFELTTNSNNETLISLKKYLEDSILTRQFVTTLVIKATHENSEGPGKATLVIYLPKITPEPVVLFDRPHYFIEVNAWIEDTGLAKLSAVAVPEEKISYSLDRFGECGALDHLELGETSGILKLNGKLTAGTYSCMAVATGVSSTKQDQAIITILVENYNNPFHPLSSVVVRHIKEDEEKIIELPCILEEPSECGYEILNQYPETEIGLFEVTEDHQIRSKGIDREMLAFTDLLIAQVTLRLKLIQVKKHSIAKRSVGGREWVNIPSDVPFTNEEFLLTVIIDDINDNRPIFSSNNLVVGYPVKQIAAFIALRNFIKVQATDADIGENAEIIYKIDNPYFNIDPTSGEIFARADLYNNLPTDILVTASNNERVGAIYSTMEIKVLALEDHHLVTLVVENLLSDDIDTTLALLSEKTGKTVVCLTWTVAFIKGADSEFFTNLIVYGIDESNPIENKILKKIIKAANLEKVMEVKDWEPQGAETKNIHFTQKYYLFETSSAYVGNIGALTATAAEVPEAIEYTLEDPLDENIRDKIVINSYSTNGTLTLTDKVAAGTYVFFVYATGEETRHVAQTTVFIH